MYLSPDHYYYPLKSPPTSTDPEGRLAAARPLPPQKKNSCPSAPMMFRNLRLQAGIFPSPCRYVIATFDELIKCNFLFDSAERSHFHHMYSDCGFFSPPQGSSPYFVTILFDTWAQKSFSNPFDVCKCIQSK